MKFQTRIFLHLANVDNNCLKLLIFGLKLLIFGLELLIFDFNFMSGYAAQVIQMTSGSGDLAHAELNNWYMQITFLNMYILFHKVCVFFGRPSFAKVCWRSGFIWCSIPYTIVAIAYEALICPSLIYPKQFASLLDKHILWLRGQRFCRCCISYYFLFTFPH